MNELDPIKPLTAFGPPLTNIPTDEAVRKMNSAYRNALPGSTAGPALSNVPSDAAGEKMRSAYRAAVTPSEGQVPPVVTAPAVPNMRMPGDVRAGAPAMPPRVVRNVPIAPAAPMVADNSIDPASGMAIMPDASGVNPSGVTRVYNEAGGGARGVGAVTRDVGGQLVTGGLILPAKAAIGALGAVGSTVADFASGLAGEPAAAAQPKVLSQPVGNGAAAAPGTTATAAPTTASAATAVPAVVRKAGPTTGMEAAPGGNLSVIPVAPGGGYSGTPGFTASSLTGNGQPGGVGTSILGGGTPPTVSAALNAAAARGDFKSIADHYQKGGGTFNGETAADVRQNNLLEKINMLPPGSKRRAALVAELKANQEGEIAKMAQKQAGTKLANETAATAAGIEKTKADTTTANLTNQTKQRTQEMLSQLAGLDNTNDPDGSQRRAIQENLLVVMHGKDPAQDKFVQYEEGTGNIDPITQKEQVIKKLFNTRTGKPVETPGSKKQNFVEGQVYKDANGNKAKWQGGKWVPV